MLHAATASIEMQKYKNCILPIDDVARQSSRSPVSSQNHLGVREYFVSFCLF